VTGICKAELKRGKNSKAAAFPGLFQGAMSREPENATEDAARRFLVE
jgi:hypothetical protein